MVCRSPSEVEIQFYLRAMLVVLVALSSVSVAQTPDLYATNHDFFDLTCASGTLQRLLHVEVDTHGQFEISVVRDGAATKYETSTYTNAVVWSEDGEQWILDRFKGTLKSRDNGELLTCERTGGRKF